MRKYALVIGGLLLSVVLGATVFSTPLAWAAQAVDATIIGPLDNGNVRVHEEGTANVRVTNATLAAASKHGGAGLVCDGAIHSIGQTIAASFVEVYNIGGNAVGVELHEGSPFRMFINVPAHDDKIVTLTQPITIDGYRAGTDGGPDCSGALLISGS